MHGSYILSSIPLFCFFSDLHVPRRFRERRNFSVDPHILPSQSLKPEKSCAFQRGMSVAFSNEDA